MLMQEPTPPRPTAPARATASTVHNNQMQLDHYVPQAFEEPPSYNTALAHDFIS